ncbi:hypothetical protein EYF80_006540 [Liparis tanakae]|uniref:Uncharacterized protein n=1 Tax=Liparis tanakae TaxID=230148 RepID=A0A4Z2IZM9_9TELE|nr:hypothetical protein EYF80_006540 [Liparis tanakae]
MNLLFPEQEKEHQTGYPARSSQLSGRYHCCRQVCNLTPEEFGKDSEGAIAQLSPARSHSGPGRSHRDMGD